MLLCLVKYFEWEFEFVFRLSEMVQTGCWVADKTGMGHEGRLL
jgi:hypothetical protein